MLINLYNIDYKKKKSAELIIDELCKLLNFNDMQSIVDFGCGEGIWLNAWKRKCPSIKKILGIDNYDYHYDYSFLNDNTFIKTSLANSIDIGKFDIVQSLEVAEHINEKYSDIFIENIIKCCPKYIIFSAAIPNQNGDGHVNCKQPKYWCDKFNKFGYKCYDIIRNNIWNDKRIYWWYRQNIMVYSCYTFENYTNNPELLYHQDFNKSV